MTKIMTKASKGKWNLTKHLPKLSLLDKMFYGKKRSPKSR